MVKLEIEGQIIVPIDPLSITYKTPCFDVDSIERGYSMPFRIAQIPAIETALKNKKRLDSKADYQNVSAKLHFANTSKQGVFAINNSENGFYDGNFRSESRATVANFEKVKLSDILLTIEIPQTVENKWYFQIRPQNIATGYSMNINGEPFSSNTAASFAADINTRFGENVATAVSSIEVQLVPLSTGVGYSIVNYTPYYNGITLSANSRTKAGAMRENCMIFIRNALLTPRSDVAFPMIYAPNLYEKNNPNFEGFVNFAEKMPTIWVLGDSAPQTESKKWSFPFIPFVRVPFILLKIAQRMGIEAIDGDFEEWQEMQQLCIFNTNTLDNEMRDYEFEELKYTNALKTEIRPSDHLEDMTITDFLRRFCGYFGLYWRIEGAKMVFGKKENLFEIINEIPFDTVVNASLKRTYIDKYGCVFSQKTTDSDSAIENDMRPMTLSKGENTYNLEAGTLAEKQGAMFSPYYSGMLCWTEAKIETKTSNLRFFFDRGEVNNRRVSASKARYGDLSLMTSALLNRFHLKTVLYSTTAFNVELDILLPVAVLQNILNFESILYRIQTKNGNFLAALDELEVKEQNGKQSITHLKFKVLSKNI